MSPPCSSGRCRSGNEGLSRGDSSILSRLLVSTLARLLRALRFVALVRTVGPIDAVHVVDTPVNRPRAPVGRQAAGLHEAGRPSRDGAAVKPPAEVANDEVDTVDEPPNGRPARPEALVERPVPTSLPRLATRTGAGRLVVMAGLPSPVLGPAGLAIAARLQVRRRILVPPAATVSAPTGLRVASLGLGRPDQLLCVPGPTIPKRTVPAQEGADTATDKALAPAVHALGPRPHVADAPVARLRPNDTGTSRQIARNAPAALQPVLRPGGRRAASSVVRTAAAARLVEVAPIDTALRVRAPSIDGTVSATAPAVVASARAGAAVAQGLPRDAASAPA